MKKIIFPVALAATLGLTTSCDDFLTTNSDSQFTPEVVYNSVVYTENALMSAYSKLILDKTYGARVPLNYATNSDIEIVGADGNSFKEDKNRGLSNYKATAGNNSLNFWEEAYYIIERTNLLIEGINGSSLLSDSDKSKTMRAFKGEAQVLRALIYFDLVRNWGDVPFKTEPTKSDGSNIYMPATDRDEIMENLLADLEEAAEYLPWINEGNYGTNERITKGFAKGLAARIALARGGYSLRNKAGFPTERGSDWEKYYEIANTLTREVIESGRHSLNSSYSNIWERLNGLESDPFNENMFEIAHGLSYSGEMGYSIGVRYNKNNKYGYGNNTNVVNTTAMYFYSFDKEDARRDATVAFWQYSNGSGDLKEVLKVEPYGLNFAKWDQKMMSNAWLTQNLAANGKAGYGINWCVMRYSDILLMFAETENELKGAPTVEAKDALKQVRRRAFGSNSAKVDAYVDALGSHEAFFNAIVDERAWEFGGEAVRKYDLIRWNMLGEKIKEAKEDYYDLVNAQGRYAFMPEKLYYKYDAAGEIIDRSSLNLYESLENAPTGYLNVSWFGGMSESNRTKFDLMNDVFSSGLFIDGTEGNKACENRHLYPYSTTTIGDSNGLLYNSYGF